MKLGDQFMYSAPDARNGASARDAIILSAGGRDNSHPITAPFRQLVMLWTVPREVAPAQAGGPGGPYTATKLLVTLEGRPTWLESEPIDSPFQAIQDMNQSPQLRTQKQLTRDARSVAVAVTEGGAPNPMYPHDRGGEKTGRMVVFGNAELFSNAMPPARGGGPAPTYELFSASLDWLRGRPPIARHGEAV